MSGHDWRAIDPTEGEIARALGDAAHRDRVLADASSNWEGVWSSGETTAAWWNDALGRFHWRVTGAAVLPWGPGHGPALGWIAPPGSVGYRGEVFVAACRCGAVGPPDALAWMGDVCGPCHDREQEGLLAVGAPPLRFPSDRNLWLTAHGGGLVILMAGVLGEDWIEVHPEAALVALHPPWTAPAWQRPLSSPRLPAVSADGSLVAILEGTSELCIVRAADGSLVETGTINPCPWQLAFAGPNGELLVGHDGQCVRGWSRPDDEHDGGGLYAVDLSRLYAAQYWGSELRVAAGGRRLVVRHGPALSVLDAATGAVLVSEHYHLNNGSPFVLTPEADVLAVSDGKLVRICGHGDTDVRRGRSSTLTRHMAISDDGRFVVASIGPRLVLYDAHMLEPRAEFHTFPETNPVGVAVVGRELLVSTGIGLLAYPWRELFGVA